MKNRCDGGFSFCIKNSPSRIDGPVGEGRQGQLRAALNKIRTAPVLSGLSGFGM